MPRFHWTHLIIAIAANVLILQTAKADTINRFEYVNGKPQFNITEHFFALYIGVWRTFDADELAAIRNNAALVSQRAIHWEVLRCDDGSVEHQDQETIWVIDELAFDQEGLITPVFEAYRPGYRYFSMANIHGLYLRGQGPYVRPSRLPGESHADHTARIKAERERWWKASSPIGTKGNLWMTLTSRLVPLSITTDPLQGFIHFEDYGELRETDPILEAIFKRTAPGGWPVHYDERAHKPHAFFEPQLWTLSATNVREDMLTARLEWNWCDAEAPLKARIVVPRGGTLPPGPNRGGRMDHGPATIEVVEE